MQIDGNTKLIALLGNPVAHTRSPLIHNTAFEAQGLNYRYAAFAVESDELAAALRGLAALGFLGANVTIPHKEAVLSLLDEVSPQAAAVGAANTIVFRGGDDGKSMRGDNTDISGFLAPLAAYVEDLRTRPVLVFGSGGGARAVVYGIATVVRPPSLCLAVRAPERGEHLLAEVVPAESGMPSLRVVRIDDSGPYVAESGLVVNCTPLGMHPHENSSPWEKADDFHPGHVVYDLIYNPPETKLLRIASMRGATCINGLEMLIQQAAASYRQWTGRQMLVEPVREALLRSPL